MKELHPGEYDALMAVELPRALEEQEQLGRARLRPGGRREVDFLARVQGASLEVEKPEPVEETPSSDGSETVEHYRVRRDAEAETRAAGPAVELCPSCGGPIDPVTWECRCT